MFKKILALLSIALIITPSFAALKVLESSTDQSMVKIGENLYVPAGANVTSAVAIGGSVTVAGNVKEDVVAVGGDVYLLSPAAVSGNVVAVGGKIEKAPGVQVKGDITEIKFPAAMITKGLGWGIAIFSVLSFIAFLVLAAFLVALFTKPLGITSYYIEKLPGHALLWGFLGAILTVPLIILMVLSVIGIPFIPVFIIILASACVFGYIAASHIVGKKFLKWIRIYNQPMMFETIIGLLLLFIINFLPIFGWIVKLLFGLMGLGAVMATRFGTQNR